MIEWERNYQRKHTVVLCALIKCEILTIQTQVGFR